MRSFDDLFRCLQSSDETTQVEAKRSEDIGKSSLHTISAFANEPRLGGGYLLLGVARELNASGDHEYHIVGVPSPDKLQSDLASQCAEVFNVPVRPQMAVEVSSDGTRVVVVHIPEADAVDKPVFLKATGLPAGAYRRIGSTDQRCSQDDVAYLYHLRGEKSFDEAVMERASVTDLDSAAIAEYRVARRELHASAAELKLDDTELLFGVGAVVNDGSQRRVTRAGMLLFGKTKALRRLCPSARVDYIIVPGQRWVANPTERYRSIEVREPLLLAIPKLVAFVAEDLPRTFQLKGRRTRRKEIPAIPYTVLREAIVNAAMHRSYRTHEPIQIIKYSGRLEIKNPGHSLVSDERLGTPGSATRNEVIAAVLHDVGYAEQKGTGIKTMREQMRAANLSMPVFTSSREKDRFEVALLTHHLVDVPTLEWLGRFAQLDLSEDETKALIVVRDTGHIDNATYRALNSVDVLGASGHLRRLRDIGLLDAHPQGSATFYTATDLLLDPASLSRNTVDKAAKSTGFPGRGRRRVAPLQLEPEMVQLLARLKGRTTRALLEVTILRLCAIRPIRIHELAQFLGRDAMYLRHQFLTKLIKTGHLQHLHPDKPAHPRQAYVTAPSLMLPAIPAEPKKRESRNPKLPF